jgi:small GTP-binding protein
MLGDFSVGKTSLVRRYVYDRFDDKYLSTIGVKISRKTIGYPGQAQLNLLIWDLAGGERFTGAQANYLRGAAGATLVCDLTRKTTLPSLEVYFERLQTINASTPVIILANKADLTENHEITEEEISQLADKLNAPFTITSAKTGAGVEDAFITLSQRILDHE